MTAESADESVIDAPEADVVDTGGDQPSQTRRMRRAIVEIRREGWKVAVIYATLDAALFVLFSNLVLSIASPSFVPTRVPIPTAVVEVLRESAGLALADPTVAGSAVLGVALGAVVFVVEVAVRVRKPLVEQFEAANADLRESLRTARDAVEDGRQSQIALRLYEDVIEELRSASSIGLLDLRRLTATVLVIAVVSLATVQLAAVDLSLGGVGDGGDDDPTDGGPSSEYGGLQDASSVLGDPEDVTGGEENLDAVVGTSGSGSGDGQDSESVAAYDSSGFGDAGSYESQQAGFAEQEQLDDAALIREYNLQIREAVDE